MVDPQLAAFKSDLFYSGFSGRASAFHAECRGFESLRPLFARDRKALPPVPQLVADSLPSLREVSAAVLRTATGIGTSLRSVRIPSPALLNHPRFEQKALRLQGFCVV